MWQLMSGLEKNHTLTSGVSNKANSEIPGCQICTNLQLGQCNPQLVREMGLEFLAY